MCRLFGFHSAIESHAHGSLVGARDALVRQAIKHPDGWGIGWHEGDRVQVVKTAHAAVDCERFRQVSASVRSRTVVAHLRKATVGELNPSNAHPFQHGRWLFAHNGSIWGFELGLGSWLEGRVSPHMRRHIAGDTDSERLFFFLLTELAKAGIDPLGNEPSDAHMVARVVREALVELDREARRWGVDRPLTNVLLTDGPVFIAHRAGFELHFATRKHFCADASTCPAEKVCLDTSRPGWGAVNHLLVASEPVQADQNRWHELADGATLALDERFHLHHIAPAADWVAPRLPTWLQRQIA